MKRKLYTKSHDINILKGIDNNGGQFTAEEHAYAIEKEFGNTILKTKNDLLRCYLQGSWIKMAALSFLKDHIIVNRYKNILSLGSGQCVDEYLLKLSLPEDSTVVASDFDAYYIEKASQFFSEIKAVTFDFFKDKIQDLEDKVNLKFDIAVFFGSACVMDDYQFINIFSGLKKTGVREIIDFHGGYMDLRVFFLHLFASLVKNTIIGRLIKKHLLTKDDYIGKFHAYSRSRSELRSLYKRCGLKIIKEIPIGNYKYVAILQ